MSEQPTEKTEYFEFLDELKMSGLCNMLESPQHLRANYPELNKQESVKIFCEWATDEKRHKIRKNE